MEPNQLILHEIAVVIVGKTHNPSILNPDFLRHNKIVPEDMKPASGRVDVVSTPVGSRIVYEGGLEITSDQQKLVFTQSVFGKKPEDTIVPNAVKTYLRTVPHVRYTAIGINLEGHLPVLEGTPLPQPSALLRNGGWAEFKGITPSAKIELKYPMDQKAIAVKVATTDIDSPVNIKDAVVFYGNFHRNADAEQESYRQIIAAVEAWEDDLSDFRRLAEQITGELK